MASSNAKYPCVQFGIHPNRKLILTLHKKIHPNPHALTNIISSLPNNSNYAHYAIMDAERIVSLNHITIAANNALMRLSTNDKITRGAALDTIVCSAGSTNMGSIMKDYAFDQHSKAATSNENDVEGSSSGYNVLLLGFDINEDEYEQVMHEIGLKDPEDEKSMHCYFERERGNDEITALIKVFKTTREEVEMQGLEKAVLNRVASKFYL